MIPLACTGVCTRVLPVAFLLLSLPSFTEATSGAVHPLVRQDDELNVMDKLRPFIHPSEWSQRFINQELESIGSSTEYFRYKYSLTPARIAEAIKLYDQKRPSKRDVLKYLCSEVIANGNTPPKLQSREWGHAKMILKHITQKPKEIPKHLQKELGKKLKEYRQMVAKGRQCPSCRGKKVHDAREVYKSILSAVHIVVIAELIVEFTDRNCSACGGAGNSGSNAVSGNSPKALPRALPKTCPKCNGIGFVSISRKECRRWGWWSHPCDPGACRKLCIACKGSGNRMNT